MILENLKTLTIIFIVISLCIYILKNFYFYKFIKKQGNNFEKFLLNTCNIFFVSFIIFVIYFFYREPEYYSNYIIICGLVEINIIFLIIILRNIKISKIYIFLFIITILELIFSICSFLIFYILNYMRV